MHEHQYISVRPTPSISTEGECRLTSRGLQLEAAVHHTQQSADGRPLWGVCLSISAHKDSKGHIVGPQQVTCTDDDSIIEAKGQWVLSERRLTTGR